MKIIARLAPVSAPGIAQSQQHLPARPVRMIAGHTTGSEIDIIGARVRRRQS